MTDPRLIAVAAELQCRCADAVDRRDWSSFRRCFTETATTDLPRTGHNGDVQQMIAAVQEVVGRLDVTQHHLSNHLVAHDGDHLVATCYVLAQHVRVDAAGAPAHYTFGGRYTDRLADEHGELRIAHRRLEVLWTTGDPALLQP